MEGQRTISFDLRGLKRLKNLHKKAVEKKRDSFFLDGVEIHTGYGKYLIEYLEAQFNRNKNKGK